MYSQVVFANKHTSSALITHIVFAWRVDILCWRRETPCSWRNINKCWCICQQLTVMEDGEKMKICKNNKQFYVIAYKNCW